MNIEHNKGINLTRSGTSGRIVWLLLFDPDIVRDESSPPLLPSSNVPDRSLFVSFNYKIFAININKI